MSWPQAVDEAPASFLTLLQEDEVCVGGGSVLKVGDEEERRKNCKKFHLLITEYIAVGLKCCCYANTLGVYFLNLREEPWSLLLCCTI